MPESGGALGVENQPRAYNFKEISKRFTDYIEQEKPGLKRFYRWGTQDEFDQYLKDPVTRGVTMAQRLLDRGYPREVAMSLSLLTLYDLVMLIDNSTSMGIEEDGARVKTLSETLKAASDVYSLAGNGGITAVRFLDSSDEYSNVDLKAVDEFMDTIVFEGVTNIGTKLHDKVLVNHVTPDMKKPLIVIVITDAEIEGEDTGLLKDVIVGQASKLQGEYGKYGPQGLFSPVMLPQKLSGPTHALIAEAVAYQFAKIGNDNAARGLVVDLDDDEILCTYIDCMGGRKDRLEDLQRDKWKILPKLLLGAISHYWDTQAIPDDDTPEIGDIVLEPLPPSDGELVDDGSGDILNVVAG